MCKKKLSKHYLAVKRCLLDVNYENFTFVCITQAYMIEEKKLN